MARTQQAGIVKSMTGATMNPDRLKALPETTREVKLGTLLGRANDICTSMGRDDEVLEGLKGMFAFKDADESRGTFKSYQFWPMGGMMQDLFDLPRKKEQVDFAFDVYAIRANNAVGRSWKVVPLFEPAGVDPLAELASKAGVDASALGGVPETTSIQDQRAASMVSEKDTEVVTSAETGPIETDVTKIEDARHGRKKSA